MRKHKLVIAAITLIIAAMFTPAPVMASGNGGCADQIREIVTMAQELGANVHVEIRADGTCAADIVFVDGTTPAATSPASPAVPYSPSAGLSRPGTNGPVGVPGGYTDCATMEALLTGEGVPSDPLVYPSTWLHDTCAAWAGGGTGAKYVQIPGPTALQMGEATGPARMLFVPSGTTFTGWTQGGWRYVSDEALLAQWKPESPPTLWGLMCGYERNLGMAVPAYKWDGTKEVRNNSLDCPAEVRAMWQGKTSTAGPEAATSVNDVGAGSLPTVVGEDWSAYPTIFKAQTADGYFCGAMAPGIVITNARMIETWPKGQGDGQYLHQAGQYGMSAVDGFCHGQPVDATGKAVTTQDGWITVLVDAEGAHAVTFPLD